MSITSTQLRLNLKVIRLLYTNVNIHDDIYAYSRLVKYKKLDMKDKTRQLCEHA